MSGQTSYMQGDAIRSASSVIQNTNLSPMPIGLFVGTGGDVEIQFIDDSSSVILKNLPDGYYIFGYVKRVNSEGTTAGDLVGMFNNG